MAAIEVTLEQALELLEDRIVTRDGDKFIRIDDLRTLKEEFAKMAEKEPEESPKTMDQAKKLAVSRIEEALSTPTGNEAVKS